MFIEGCGAEDLARAYGTPLYVYSEPDIVDKCRGTRREFLDKYEDTRAAYAAKAFCTMGMVKLVEREGLPLEKALPLFTSNVAEALGFGADCGRLAPGARADILLVDGSWRIQDVLVRGKLLMSDGVSCVPSYYRQT